MIKDINTTIKEIIFLNKEIVQIIFSDSYEFLPGQFLMLKLEGFFLRRPFVIIETKGLISIIFKITGEGTKHLSKLVVGSRLNILLPLGNMYKPKSHSDLILIGGGTGLASLIPIVNTYYTAYNIHTFIGFKNKANSFYEDFFISKTKANFAYNEDEKSCFKGTVCDLLKNNIQKFSTDTPIFACGPNPMLKNLNILLENYNFNELDFSLEEKMACGVGACLGCVVKTNEDYKRVCIDGPIFKANKLIL